MDLFKGICLFLKIFVVTLLRITKKEGIVHHEPPKLLLRDWLLLQNHRAKIVKILFLPAEYIILLENCIFCYINFDNNCIKKTLRLITSQSIQLMNFKFYYEESLLRQCFFSPTAQQ